jgi:aubergine-like protein
MKKTIYLIPELMNMTGLTDQMRNNGRLMKALAEYTKLSPYKRMEEIRRTSDKLTS